MELANYREIGNRIYLFVHTPGATKLERWSSGVYHCAISKATFKAARRERPEAIFRRLDSHPISGLISLRMIDCCSTHMCDRQYYQLAIALFNVS